MHVYPQCCVHVCMTVPDEQYADRTAAHCTLVCTLVCKQTFGTIQ